MASRAQQLQQKLCQSDAMINLLKRQMAILKINSTATTLELEEKALRVENEALTKQVNSLKSMLADLESKHGLVQVPLPGENQKGTNVPAGIAKSEMKTEAPKQRPRPKKEAKKETVKSAVKKVGGETASGGGEGSGTGIIDVSRLDFRIGKILDIKEHPDADELYVETVDVGEEKPRTILSGLVKHVPIEEMQDRRAVFLCNLKPAKMRGILSEGMIMCASADGKIEVIEVPEAAVAGDLISVEGYPRTPDSQLNPKKKIFEKLKPDLLIDASGFATFKSAKWVIDGKGYFKAKTLVNAQIS